jgi:hypothetical protein
LRSPAWDSAAAYSARTNPALLRLPHRYRLVACAHHTAVHRKYGNPLDCAARFGAALGVSRLQ